MKRSRQIGLALVLVELFALSPGPVRASSWGSSYGDPPGFCTNHSQLPGSYGVDITNDPLVGDNPEQDTFFGYHPDPGYDDWYGFFYGDFRGAAADTSGWVYLTRDAYPAHSHWNFADFGWAVHGHAKQYVAYYNWTFGGECGMGVYGSSGAPPYMADQFGTPVLDIYVDSTPPDVPQPHAIAADTSSVTFAWDSVVDRGDGWGIDYFAIGMDHYASWISIDGGPPLQYGETPAPRTMTAFVGSGQTACIHVNAVDRLFNASTFGVACAQAAGPPPPPPPPASAGAIAANPAPRGLVGLDSWFWIQPPPVAITTDEVYQGNRYRVISTPSSANWGFGDGSSAVGDFGIAYPRRSSVMHAYEGWSGAGFGVTASVHYTLTWSVWTGARWDGPYGMTGQDVATTGLVYPVIQAQPQVDGGP